MSDILVGIAFVLAVLFLAILTLLEVLNRRRTPRPGQVLQPLILESFIVTLDSGESFRGLLKAVDEGWLLLVEAEALGSEGRAVPVDGHLLLPRPRIAFLQRP